MLVAILVSALGMSFSDAPLATDPPRIPAAMPVLADLPDDPVPIEKLVPPSVELSEPLGTTVSVHAPIQLAFSQPMNHSSVERSFTIQPQIDGTFTWFDDSTLVFQPLRLTHNTTYQVEVRGRSLRGRTLSGRHGWRFTTAGGAPTSLAPGPAVIRVPVLMYHYIRVNPDPRDRAGYALSVTPADFEAQLDWLQAHGFNTITFGELNAYLHGVRGLPAHPVILTFDDGYADFYTSALPALISHDFTADAYVVSGFVGRPGYMSASQVAAADRAGIEIGAHTVDHVDLTRLPNDAVRYQLSGSKQALEGVVGHPVLSFCYPYGQFDARVASLVQAAGYRDATTTQWGTYRSLGGRYVWGRVRVFGGERLWQFAQGVLAAA